MEMSVSSCNELLHFVGEALEISKCAWYLIKWNFDLQQFTANSRDKGISKHHYV